MCVLWGGGRGGGPQWWCYSQAQGAHAGIIRSYNVLFSFFTCIRLLERSYFCLFFFFSP